MKKWTVLFLMCLLVSGCATVETVKDARGSGRTQVYNASYDKTYDAAIDAMRDCAIEILEKHKDTGSLIGKKGISYTSYGERVAVYLYKIDDNHTKVEVISRKVLATNIFAKDWTDDLFQKIGEDLK